MNFKYALLVAGLLAGGLAQAQSHSVANYSNPPNVQADSKAGTAATPGKSGGTGKAAATNADENVPSGKLRKAKPVKKATAKSSASKPKEGAEQAMQTDASEAQSNDAQKHAFDTTPTKR